jgi:hypothetical protein
MDITYSFLKVLALILLKACTTSNGNDHIDDSHDYLRDDSIQSQRVDNLLRAEEVCHNGLYDG